MATRRQPEPPPPTDGAFLAIDFETADNDPDSACAVGLARVERLRVVHREKVLIRPPRSRFRFSWLHGITWDMVKDAPTFAEVWPRLTPLLNGVTFLAAHNAPFDRRVLLTCCAVAELAPPQLPFVCTVQVSRRRWGLKPNDLASVCRRLGIGLIHHDPLSDAEACARIMIAASHPEPSPHIDLADRPHVEERPKQPR
jgi:DNA polymerase-3 subunit epsilon